MNITNTLKTVPLEAHRNGGHHYKAFQIKNFLNQKAFFQEFDPNDKFNLSA